MLYAQCIILFSIEIETNIQTALIKSMSIESIELPSKLSRKILGLYDQTVNVSIETTNFVN